MITPRRIATGLLVLTLLVLPVAFYTFEGLYLYTPVKTAWLAGLAFLLLAVLGWERFQSRLSLRPPDWIEICLFFFLGWTALAGLFAVNVWVAFEHWLLWLAATCAFWFVRRLERDVPIALALLAGSALVVLLGYLQLLGVGIPKALDQYGSLLPTSSMGHANYAAQAALPFIAAPLAVFLVARRRSVASLGLGLGVIGLPYLMATASRGAVVALVAGLVAVAAVVWLRSEDRPYRVIAFLTLLPVTAGLAALIQPEWSARFLQAFDPAQASTADRIHLWRDSLSAIAANPWFGFGPGQFLYVFPEYWSADTARQILGHGSRLAENPHQDVLALALGGGVPAALAFLAFCILVLHRAWDSFTMKTENAEWKWGALAVVLVWLAYGLIDYPLHAPVPLFGFFVVMGLLAPIAKREEPAVSGPNIMAPVVMAVALIPGVLYAPSLIGGITGQAHAVRASELLQSNPTRAMHYASQAVERDRRNPLAHSMLGQARLIGGARARIVDYDQVVSSLNEALRWYPVDFQTRYNLGVALYQQALDQGGSTAAARREFLSVTELNPYYAKGYYMLASLDARDRAPWEQVRKNLAVAIRQESELLQVAARAPEFQRYHEVEDALRRWAADKR